MGTRFVASVEAGAPKRHKELVVSAGYDDVIRTLIYSGRPMSVRKTPYVEEWCVQPFVHLVLIAHYVTCREKQRSNEIQELISQGKVPHEVELAAHPEKSVQGLSCTYPLAIAFHIAANGIRAPGLMGRVAGSINDIKPAKEMYVPNLTILCPYYQ